jgi:hypothetical protein
MKFLLILLAGILLAAGYVMYLRPVFERLGVVRALPADVSGCLARIKAYVDQSWTMAWQMLVGFVSSAFTVALTFAETFGMADVKADVKAAFVNYPEAVGAGFLAVAIITAIARARTMGK